MFSGDNEIESNSSHDEEEDSSDSDTRIYPSEDEDESESIEVEVKPFSAMRGFFHPYFKERDAEVSVADEAKNLLDTVKILREKCHYQKVYFTCSMNLAMANEIEEANKKGERLTRAKKHYNPANREATLMLMVEQLLETEEEYAELRSFYIAPLSTCAEPGGKGRITEDIIESQLQKIKTELDQGHAVFCLTDEASWQAQKPLSVTEEKLSIKKGDEVTFPPALNELAQTTLASYQADYPIPEAVLHTLQDEALKKKEEDNLDTLKKALNDVRFLKTWPLQIEGISWPYTITTKQKRKMIQNKIQKIVNDKGQKIIFSEGSSQEDEPSSKALLECQQLARKYTARLKTYLYHELSNKTSTDLASKSYRVKLLKILIRSLSKVYSPKISDEERFDTQDFFDIVDSAESYVVELRGTHFKLQSILNDLAWEARLLKKTLRSSRILPANEALQPFIKTFSEGPMTSQSAPPIMASQPVPTTQPVLPPQVTTFMDDPTFISRFREASDADKVTLLKEHLALELDKNFSEHEQFPYRYTPEHLAIKFDECFSEQDEFPIPHNSHVAERIKSIQTDDLTQYWLLLLAEARAQGFFWPSLIKRALEKALNVLNAEFQGLSPSLVRHFKLQNAARLLDFGNDPTNYDCASDDFIAAQKLGLLAHKLVLAETPAELHLVVLEASEFKKKPSRTYFQKELNRIIDKLEKRFVTTFKDQPLSKKTSPDKIWQDVFGAPYLDTKFKVLPDAERERMVSAKVFAADQLTKRCYTLAKEMQNKDLTERAKDYQRTRMCALADVTMSSKYPQVIGRKVREQIGARYLEQFRGQYASVYCAQTCLAKMDEVETQRGRFKAHVEKILTPFLTKVGEEHNLVALHLTLKVLSDQAKSEENFAARFFSPSKLRVFLEQFARKLEEAYPELALQAKEIKKQLGL